MIDFTDGKFSEVRTSHSLAWGLAYFLLGLACFGGHLASGDAEAYFAVAWHLLMIEPPTIPRYLEGYGVLGPGGLYYAKFGLGQSLLILPLLLVALVMALLGGRVLAGAELRASALLIGPIMGGVGVLLFDRIQARLNWSEQARWISCLFLVAGGLWLVYGRYLFSELSVGVMLLLLVYGRVLDSGFGDGLMGLGSFGAVLLRAETVLIVGPVLLIRVLRTRRWTRLVFVPLLAPLLIGFYNYARFSTPLRMGMGESAVETFSTPILIGFLGQFVAPGNGLFVYAPYLLVVVLVTADRWIRVGFGPPVWIYALLGGSVLYLGLHARWHSWMGGWSWGPRRMIPLLPLLHLLIGWNWSRLRPTLKRFMLVLLGMSVILNLGGLVGDFNRYYRGNFYRVDVLWDASHAQLLHQNLRIWFGSDPLDLFWVRLLGPVSGTGVVLVLLAVALSCVYRVCPFRNARREGRSI